MEIVRIGIRTRNLLLRKLGEMIRLPLVRRTAPMPKEQPLQRLTPLQLILEPKHVVLVRKLEQVQQFGRRLHDGERGRLRVVDEDGDSAVGVEAEKPVFLLLVGHDVAVGVEDSHISAR